MSETITSPQNEKLKLVRRLAERRHREREGLFVTEGEDLLSAGLRAGRTPEFALVAPESGLEGIAVSAALLDQASALGSGTRAIAVWAIPEPASFEPGLCVFLDAVADPGNVGSIVRTAAALADASVVLGPGSADPWGPKSVRASMGAVFASAPRLGTVEDTPSPRLALVAHDGEDLDAAITALRPRTVCLGAEREGLDSATRAACQTTATIRLSSAAESLNVAAAAAIALHRVCSAAAASTTIEDGHPISDA